jgi:hypothetical protein
MAVADCCPALLAAVALAAVAWVVTGLLIEEGR